MDQYVLCLHNFVDLIIINSISGPRTSRSRATLIDYSSGEDDNGTASPQSTDGRAPRRRFVRDRRTNTSESASNNVRTRGNKLQNNYSSRKPSNVRSLINFSESEEEEDEDEEDENDVPDAVNGMDDDGLDQDEDEDMFVEGEEKWQRIFFN